MSDLVIDLSHVEKTYRGKVRALRGITMQVHPGEIFGLLGPNGAGKSTLVKILMTVIRPTRCEGTMLGKAVGHKPTLGRVGYLPEHHRFPEYLTAAQVLDYFGALSKVDRRTRRARADTLLGLVGIRDWRDSKVGGFSKGMRQRLGLAAAMINDPDLIILDEPTDGVDPVGRREIRMVLVELKDRGKTIFLNSHLLSELEMVCDRVAILVQGEVASQGTIESLTKDSRRIEIAVQGTLPDGLSLDGTGASPAEGAAPNGLTRLTISGDDASLVQPVIDRLRAAGAVIVSITPVRESLEDLFMRAVLDPATGDARKPGAVRGGGSAA